MTYSTYSTADIWYTSNLVVAVATVYTVYGSMEAGYFCLCSFVLGGLTGRPPKKMYGRPMPTHPSEFM